MRGKDRDLHERNRITADDLGRITSEGLWILVNPTDRHRTDLEPNLAALPATQTVVEWNGVGAWPYWEDPGRFVDLAVPFLGGA